MAVRSPLTPVVDLVRCEPRTRVFFFAHAQSSLGNGAAYVALLVLAYERFPSPWAIALVLLADMLPPMLLGPLFGAAADRWSRRWCAVLADGMRAVAFIGIALFGGFEAMVALALLAGLGTSLFHPAILAGLPSLVDRNRLPAATSLYGALDDLGHTLGPLLAAAVLLLAGPETVMIANGATFALSALLLARLPFGASAAGTARTTGDGRPSLGRETSDGLRAAAAMPGVPMLILGSSGLLLFAGLFNVGELLLAKDELGAGSSGYAILVAVFGIGFAAGSLAGSRGGTPEELKGRYLAGILLTATGFFGCGLAPSFGVALVTFALGGFGNGLVIVHERLLLQALVPDGLLGRVFGIRDSVQCWAFAPGFICAGVLASLLGPRALFLLGGAGALLVWGAAGYALRHTWRERRRGSALPAARPLLAES